MIKSAATSKLTKAAISLTTALAGMSFAISAAAQEASCDRAMLQGIADAYIASQSNGNPAGVPLAENAYYGENDIPMAITDGVISGEMVVDFTRNLLDTTQCATFTELVAANNPHPYVIHTRMEVNGEGQVTVMESVVTDEDDWVFGAEPFLQYTSAEDWSPIPPVESTGPRPPADPRQTIKYAAEAYINNWGDPYLPVPHGTPCNRLEGRLYTGANDPEAQSCTMGAFPQPIQTGSRRYVIDETIGAINIFHRFSWLDAGVGPYHPGIPVSHVFRVEDGENRYIHEVTSCITPKCGRGF